MYNRHFFPPLPPRMRALVIVALALGLVTAWAVADTPQCKDFEKAVTLDQASCNGHGTLYPDTGVCECWSPYEGSTCEKQSTQPGAIDVGVSAYFASHLR